MSAMPSPMQPEFSAGSLTVKPAVETSALHPGDVEEEQIPRANPVLQRRRAPLGLIRFLIAFCVGVAATVVWYSYGDAARETIANTFPELGWLAPQAAPAGQSAPLEAVAPAAASPDVQPSAVSLDLGTVRQNVDRIATSQDQIIRSIDQLTAGQEQLTREIAKLQAVEQYILYKNSEPQRPASPPANARRPAAPQTSQAGPPAAR
jgi:hypothetical protein